MLFAANLRSLRNECHCSQVDLAKRSGIHASEISRLEKGQRDVRLTTAVKLAEGLGVSIDRLFQGIGQHVY